VDEARLADLDPGQGFLTVGQPAAIAAVRVMLGPVPPHAVLLVGPVSVGKTTLALDFAAGLLCTDPEPARRPCRGCRSCRRVAAGNHPDLHRLAPTGPGRQIAIGEPPPADPAPGTIRHLVGELSLLPVEGGARVAVIEQAERMNEDAQNALLKTLEEPPAGVTIVLCASDEDRLLPTVRSRCARVRLGPVARREVERLLVERGAADPPTAARLARLSAGRPGLALAYALAPEAVVGRDEIARSFLDLLAARRSVRLAAIRRLLARAAELSNALERADDGRSPEVAEPAAVASAAAPAGTADGAEQPGRRGTAAERRRAALALLDVWRDVARDLAIAARGGGANLRDRALLDDLQAAARTVDPVAAASFLARLARTALLVEANANPELALDALVLAWPDATAA